MSLYNSIFEQVRNTKQRAPVNRDPRGMALPKTQNVPEIPTWQESFAMEERRPKSDLRGQANHYDDTYDVRLPSQSSLYLPLHDSTTYYANYKNLEMAGDLQLPIEPNAMRRPEIKMKKIRYVAVPDVEHLETNEEHLGLVETDKYGMPFNRTRQAQALAGRQRALNAYKFRMDEADVLEKNGDATRANRVRAEAERELLIKYPNIAHAIFSEKVSARQSANLTRALGNAVMSLASASSVSLNLEEMNNVSNIDNYANSLQERLNAQIMSEDVKDEDIDASVATIECLKEMSTTAREVASVMKAGAPLPEAVKEKALKASSTYQEHKEDIESTLPSDEAEAVDKLNNVISQVVSEIVEKVAEADLDVDEKQAPSEIVEKVAGEDLDVDEKQQIDAETKELLKEVEADIEAQPSPTTDITKTILNIYSGDDPIKNAKEMYSVIINPDNFRPLYKRTGLKDIKLMKADFAQFEKPKGRGSKEAKDKFERIGFILEAIETYKRGGISDMELETMIKTIGRTAIGIPGTRDLLERFKKKSRKAKIAKIAGHRVKD